jgi:cholesterol transport system auxiliary component
MALLLAASGCVGALKSDYPERRFYTLAAERPGAAAAPAKDGVLRVRRFTASKLSEGTELVTRTGEAEYETDFYNVFFAPPASQLTEQAQRWLGASGLFSAVVGTGSSVPETHVLEGNLISLYTDGRENRAEAVLALQVLLVRVSSDPSTVVFEKTYKIAEKGMPGSPESSLKAWNAGLQRILAELEADLAKAERSPKK